MKQDSILSELVDSIMAQRHLQNYPQLYFVGDRLVAKKYALKAEACRDYDTGRFFFNKGISVPKTYSIIEPGQMLPVVRELELKEKNFRDWYVVMQKIEGEMVGTLRGQERERAEELLSREIEKALRLNMTSDDCFYGGNSIYSREKDRTFLIDLNSWKRCSHRSPDKVEIRGLLSAPGRLVDDVPKEEIFYGI